MKILQKKYLVRILLFSLITFRALILMEFIFTGFRKSQISRKIIFLELISRCEVPEKNNSRYFDVKISQFN